MIVKVGDSSSLHAMELFFYWLGDGNELGRKELVFFFFLSFTKSPGNRRTGRDREVRGLVEDIMTPH